MKTGKLRLSSPGHFWIACLLLILYFVLHEFNAHFGLIKSAVAFKLIIRYVLIGASIALISQVFFKKWAKSFLFCFTVLVFMLFFGAMHDRLIMSIPDGLFTSHLFIFLVIGMILLACAKGIARARSIKPVVYQYIVSVAFLLFCWELLSVVINVVRGDRNYLALPVELPPHSETRNNEKPDIFFLVFDSYPSSLSLQRDFQFDNGAFDSFLLKQGFFISTHSKSNYPVTTFSLASTLNMQYLDPKAIQGDLTATTMLKGASTIYHSRVPQLLKKEGYGVYNFSIFDLEDYPARPRSFFAATSERLIDQQTLPGRVKSKLMWKFIIDDKSPATTIAPRSILRHRDNYIDDFIKNNIGRLERTISREKDSIPAFIYCHVMLPHEPYFFNRDGSMTSDSVLVGKFVDRRTKFIDQTIYANTIIEKLLHQIMNGRQRPYVIILQGDHGFRDVESDEQRDNIFDNLNAYYFSDRDYALLYDSISPVNSFRVVWNKYFKGHYPLLPDNAIYVRDRSFKFEH